MKHWYIQGAMLAKSLSSWFNAYTFLVGYSKKIDMKDKGNMNKYILKITMKSF